MLPIKHKLQVNGENDDLALWLDRLANLQHDPVALLPKLKRCCTMFQFNPQYRNDTRYLHLWIAFADTSDEPTAVFSRLHKKGIGLQLSIFWSAWAIAAHASGNPERAYSILNEGVEAGAEPRSFLDEIQIELKLEPLKSAVRDSDEPSKRKAEYEIDNPDRKSLKISPGRRKPLAAIKTNQSSQNEVKGTAKLRSPILVKHSFKSDAAAECVIGLTDKLQKVASVAPIHPYAEPHRTNMTTQSQTFTSWAEQAAGKLIFDFRTQSLRRWPRKMARISASHLRKATRGNVNTVEARLGTRTVHLDGELGSGAYATVYRCRLRATDEFCAVKVERPAASLPWEFYVGLQLDHRLREAPNLPCAAPDLISEENSKIVLLRPRQLFEYSDGYAMPMRIGTCGTLHDLAAAHVHAGTSMPELVVAHYGAEMARFIRAVHGAGILHCDIKPDNWLITSRPTSEKKLNENCQYFQDTASDSDSIDAHAVSLIDFGRSIDLKSYPPNQSFQCSTRHAASGFGCPQMAEGNPWTYQLDLCAFASTLHYLLFFEPLKAIRRGNGGRWGPSKRFRRYWCIEVWEKVFDALLNEGGDTSENVLLEVEATLLRRVRDNSVAENELKVLLRKQNNLLLGL